MNTFHGVLLLQGRRKRQCQRALILLFLAALAPTQGAATTAPLRITLGQSIVRLNGPWKFHTGDDPAWGDPRFDDSSWEVIDLTAAPGAHDEDVGLSGYVPGWGARGHRGYCGYAWYRLHLAIDAPVDAALQLAGPPAVDSAYQVFIDGRLLGGAGRFSGKIPTVYSIQPRAFAIRRPILSGEDGPLKPTLVAFRVWMDPWDLEDPSAGGIRIAPVLGEASSIDALYQIQWLQTLRGYIVEVVEAAAFVLLAVMVWTLMAFDPAAPGPLWLCAALVLTASYRANQAMFFWGQFESVHAFEMISVVLLIPLCLAAWTLAGREWFRLPATTWMLPVAGAFTVMYIGAQFLTRSWFHGALPHRVDESLHFIATGTRVLFALMTAYIAYRAIRERRREAWLGLSLMALVSIGQFAAEFSGMGIRGIWFPFGAGVSRTQFAYALFDIVLFAALLRGFLSAAGRRSNCGTPFTERRSCLN